MQAVTSNAADGTLLTALIFELEGALGGTCCGAAAHWLDGMKQLRAMA